MRKVNVEDEVLAGAKFEEIVGSSESLVQALGQVAEFHPQTRPSSLLVRPGPARSL